MAVNYGDFVGGIRKIARPQFAICSHVALMELAKAEGEKFRILKRNGHWRVKLADAWLYSNRHFERALQYVVRSLA